MHSPSPLLTLVTFGLLPSALAVAQAGNTFQNAPELPEAAIAEKSSGASSGNAEADFAARCSAPGVVYCNGFDSPEELAEGISGDNCSKARKSSLSAAQKASGNSSLMFEFAQGVSCSNIGGNWQYTHPTGFGEGDDLYVQYRFRASPEYFSNNAMYWQSTVKQINIHGSGSSCQNTEITGILSQRTMQFYHTCAGIGLIADLYDGSFLSKCTRGECLINQGSTLRKSANAGYNCDYGYQGAGKGNGDGCFWPVAEKWYTIYIHYDLNTHGGNDNGYYAWESHEGGPYRQYMNIDGDGPWVAGGSSTYQEFWLETYMSEIKEAAPSTAYLWYDELIISTQPIAAPRF